MARARAGEQQRPRAKTDLLEELSLGINKLQELLTAIHDFSQDGFPYRDAARSKAELKFRECLRQTFGERSQEFQTHRNFKIRTGEKRETAQSVAVIKGLIQTLEDRKLELLGLKPPATSDPAPQPTPHPAPHLELVSASTLMSAAPPTPPPTPISVTTVTTPPVETSSAASTSTPPRPSSVGTPAPISTPTIQPLPSVTPLTSAPPIRPELVTPTPPLTSTPILPPTPQSFPAAIESPPSLPVAPIASPFPTRAPSPSFPPISSSIDRPVDVVQAPASPLAAPPTPFPPPHIDVPTPETSPRATPSTLSPLAGPAPHRLTADNPSINPSVTPTLEAMRDHDPLSLIRKVCQRFHSVARQLRLRKDYRPTIEVDDEYDLQDLLCALLKVEFDEVATDDWTPPYTEGASRTTLLVNRDQIAIVAKKTGSGLTTKELTDQVLADAAHYRTQGRCSILFCFVYDPEGRIGSPKRLETTLTSVSEHCRIEVLVAPK